MLFPKSLLASLLVLPLPVLSYQLHQSCVDKGVVSLLRDGMTGAFEMVDSALRHLNQDPYDQDTADLIRRLFLGKSGQNVNDRRAMRKVVTIFENINENYRTETTDVLESTDLIIYCDDSRYVEEEREQDSDDPKKIWRDQITNELVAYDDIACHGTMSDRIALAVTRNPEVDHETHFEPYATVLMLCPWFIDWIKSKEYKLGNEVMRSNIGRFVVKQVEANRGLRQIDALSLLDKVLLHEMTHGRMAFTGYHESRRWAFWGTADVALPRTLLGIPIPPLSLLPAYGWTSARTLASIGDDVVGMLNWSPRAADHNADSYALFGSAAKLLDHEWPRRVLDDGRFEPVGV